jgi:Spx/MgsR family transcriptional regulator
VDQAEKYGMMAAMQTPHITVYGIPNCDSVKKARQWMEAHQVAHHFHDFKKHGLEAADLDLWLSQVDWTVLLNRKGTTWRGLDAATQNQVCDAATAKRLMLLHPSLVKRPLVVADQKVTVGVNPSAWESVV